MKLTQLEYFCTAVQCKSITQAAKKLYVTQPAISGAIRELEKEFAVSLFSHSRNKLSLTEDGQAFYLRAAALLQKAMIHNNTCASFFYASLLQDHPDMVGIPIEPRIEQKVGLIWRKGKYTPKSVQAFLSFVKDYPLFPEEN